MALTPAKFIQLQQSQPITRDQAGHPAPWFMQALNNTFKNIVDAVNGAIAALNAAAAAQAAADTAQDTAMDAQGTADTAQTTATSAAATAGAAQTTATGASAAAITAQNRADDAYDLADSAVQQDAGPAWINATGTATRTAYASYAAPVISATPTQAEVQAIADAVQALSQHVVAIINDLKANGALT